MSEPMMLIFPRPEVEAGNLAPLLLRSIMKGWVPMNEMCERAGFSERAIYDRSKAIMGYYHLPFDVPPP